jgi:DNA-binding NarL/FixJ family response regulator
VSVLKIAARRARVLLADDHAHTAEQLRQLLRSHFDVVAQCADGCEMVDAAEQLLPDVVVADLSLPGLDGIDAAALIRRRDPHARIVLVTVHDEPLLVERALATGVLGYVLKDSAGDELVDAVRAALDNRQYVSRALWGAEGDR